MRAYTLIIGFIIFNTFAYKAQSHAENRTQKSDNKLQEKKYENFEDKDIGLTVEGLSPEYAQRFKDKKHYFSEYLNKLSYSGLPKNIKPINIKVTYINDEGFVTISYLYKSEEFPANDPFAKGSNRPGMPKGVNLAIEYLLSDAINFYKIKVADNGDNTFNTKIANFKIGINMKKPNGDSSSIFAESRLNSAQYYDLYIYPQMYLKIQNKMYDIQSSNPNILNEYHIFTVDSPTGLDGKANKNLYLYRFYNIPVN